MKVEEMCVRQSSEREAWKTRETKVLKYVQHTDRCSVSTCRQNSGEHSQSTHYY
jgi:hypothetical protein